jgi:hypothetical protein
MEALVPAKSPSGYEVAIITLGRIWGDMLAVLPKREP